MAIFVKIDGHRTSGLEVGDFETIWSACQRDDGSCCELYFGIFDGHVFL